MSQANAFLRTITGKNKTGQVLFGLLDFVLPSPIHNIFRQVVHKEGLRGMDAVKAIWSKIEIGRLVVTSVVALLWYFDKFKVESLGEFVAFLEKIMPYVNAILSLFID